MGGLEQRQGVFRPLFRGEEVGYAEWFNHLWPALPRGNLFASAGRTQERVEAVLAVAATSPNTCWASEALRGSAG